MKKLLAITSVLLVLILIFTACGNSDEDFGNDGNITDNIGIGNNENPANNQGNGETNTPADNFDASRVIAVFTREDGSGTRDAFVSITGVGDNMYVEAGVENETAGIRTKVESNPYAIGYISVGSLNNTVKAVSIEGVVPSDETIMDGSYTLQRPLLVCINEEKAQNELVQDFIAFMLSAEGQEISATRWTKVDVNAPAYTTSGLTGTLKVGGSTSVEPLMQPLREAYMAHNPGVEIEISGGGSGTGISEATNGVIDIGMSSRALRDNEKEALEAINIALDGVAVIVNPDNPVNDMTIEQVREIFTGEVTRWTGVN